MLVHREGYLCMQDWLCFMARSPGYSKLNVAVSGPSAQCSLDLCGSGGLVTERTANKVRDLAEHQKIWEHNHWLRGWGEKVGAPGRDCVS